MTSEPRTEGLEPEVLHIEGELTVFRAAELKPLMLCTPPPATIDLSGVTEIDTAGVQLLLLARRTAKAEQRALRLRAPSAAVSEVLGLLNLVAVLAIEPATAPAGA